MEFSACSPYSSEETKKRRKQKEAEFWKDVVEIHYVIQEEGPLHTQEDCLELQENENACDKCENYTVCWDETPRDAANAEYERIRGV